MKGHLLLFAFVTLITLGILSVLTSVGFKKKELPWKIIALYLIGSFLAQGVSIAYWLLELNNLRVLHVYSLFQFIAFSAFFWSTTRTIFRRKIILTVTGIVAAFLVVNSIYNESLRDFNSIGIFISHGTIIVYSVAYFFEVLGAEISTKKHLIVNAGILLFTCESLVIFLFGNFLKKVELIDQVVLWYTHAVTYFLFLILIYWNHAKLNRIR